MITDEEKERALELYIDMKRRAGVKPGCEFLKIVDGQILPCSKEEYLKLEKEKESGRIK